MPSYTLSTIISKFLKKISLTTGEKNEICNEIGAVRSSSLSQGAQGDEDNLMVAQYGPLGQLQSSGLFLLYGGDGTGLQAQLYFEDNKLKIGTFSSGGNESYITFPNASSFSDISFPEGTGTLAFVDGDGYVPLSNLPQIVTYLSVVDEDERLEIPLDVARNRIVLQGTGEANLRMYLLDPGAIAADDDSNWKYIGEMGTSSEGGNGSSDWQSFAAYDSAGGLKSTNFLIVKDFSGGSNLIQLYNDSNDGLPEIKVSNGTYFHNITFPAGTGDRTWSFSDASGTIATSGSAVMLSGNQTVGGTKSFSDPAVFNDNVQAKQIHVVEEFIIENKHSILFSDFVVNSSASPSDTGLEIFLETGIYEINLFASFSHGSTGGARIKLAFDGTISTLGGKVEIFTYGGSPQFYHLTNGGGGEGFVSDIVKNGSTDSAFYTTVLYEVSAEGLLKVQFAQETSNATDSTMLAGSYIKAVTKLQ